MLRARGTFALLLFAIAAGGLAFRLPRLDRRPMHQDEAVQAHKAGVLIDTGLYRYDPHEHHGPTLYYCARASARLTGARTFADTTEWTFRIVPVVFGVGLILLLWPLADALGKPAALAAALLTAVSPAMVFYSRYYIQETLLVFFTFGAIAGGLRYARTRAPGWALWTGACLGLMYATKETCVIAYACMAAALLLTYPWKWRQTALESTIPDQPQGQLVRHVGLGVGAAGIVAVFFFSSFFDNLTGPLDSLRAYGNYFGRATETSIHYHPWWFYLGTLLYTRRVGGPKWSEGLIVALAIVGAIGTFTKTTDSAKTRGNRPFLRFLDIYTLLMTVVYSLIPYKTPWCMLSFLHGMILLAGVGAATVLRRTPTKPLKGVIAALLALGVCHLAVQAHRANFRYAADWRNPYVYGHTSPAFLRLANRVEELAQVCPDGRDMLIRVIEPQADYWPLPWYLRKFHRVGYWTALPEEVDAPLIIVSPALQNDLDKRLHDSYQVEFHALRPGVLLLAYIQSDLWEAFLATR